LKACWEARWGALYSMNVPTTTANNITSAPPPLRCCKGNGIAGSSSPRGHTSAWRHRRLVGTEWGRLPRRHASSSGLRRHGMFEAGRRWGDLPMAGPPLPGAGVGESSRCSPSGDSTRFCSEEVRDRANQEVMEPPKPHQPRNVVHPDRYARSSEPLNAGLTGGLLVSFT
jgi:hypothetical protein